MGKVIIITTPRPTKPDSKGQAIVAGTDDTDSYHQLIPAVQVYPGHIVMSSGTYTIGDVMECNITDSGTGEIGNVIEPSTLAKGKVTRVNVDVNGKVYSEFKVDELCAPNPYYVELGSKLYFTDSYGGYKVGDPVECIPLAKDIGALVAELENW
jgi:hypothetical protein